MNTPLADSTGALPFFMPASPGERFCIFHLPAPGQKPHGAILYIHPFGEELNKSRRTAALQARAFAASGYSVLQIDLYGCGDSSGEFADARWHIWRHDLRLASAWLAQRVNGPLSLWGLRLGGLLALDVAHGMRGAAGTPLDQLILWHPVLKGSAFVDQLLRIELASRMLSGADSADGMSARQQLAAGRSIEVGGYQLTPELACAIDAIDLAAMTPGVPVRWFENTVNGDVAPAAMRQAERWTAAGVELELVPVQGLPFWNSGEIIECQALLAATAARYP
ncbi:hydrolase 2, exosortase A system-associated [Janthinobacterium agaricidamnosum]|uniref:Hydrolase-like 2, exosortase system type 1 associated n=1 Tax=Janthinobacterium agaricidamnosum NBRC 102515 = DSM 9628 TaxID=1349767 RepID=W0V7G9_9BURK|nr:hydrolase 2, exosortase A system-associated [Janthinobacterium agaricidamnosum]CDG83298.1 hydrolase-like 2, exosortase system type 1 associated [Janthinobacterium agaricidamnosum NBRC 102515 = DSM 9628]